MASYMIPAQSVYLLPSYWLSSTYLKSQIDRAPLRDAEEANGLLWTDMVFSGNPPPPSLSTWFMDAP